MAMQDQTQTGNNAEQEHRWVVMVYLAGDNNLGDEMVWSLKSIADNCGDDFDVFAQYDSRGRHSPAVHFDLRQNGHSPPLQVAGKRALPARKFINLAEQIQSQTSVKEDLKAFIDRCMEKVAKMKDKNKLRFLLVLSGHGSGAVGGFLNSVEMADSLSLSQLTEAVNYTRGQIQKALGFTKELDILGMDSCLMNMAEISHQLEDGVRYMIGAQGFEANTGWPYHKILGILQANPGIDTASFVEEIVEEYRKYYSDYVLAGVSTDLSACKLSEYRNRMLDGAMRNLTELLCDGLEKGDKRLLDAIVLAHWRSQSYKWEQYTDLWDFCQVLRKDLGRTHSVSKACTRVKRAIRYCVVHSSFSGPGYQHSHGLSVYFPWYRSEVHMREYRKLPFAKESGWTRFLDLYLEKTQREPRCLGNGARARRAFPAVADQDVKFGTIHDVRFGTIHDVRFGTIHNVKYQSLLAGTMKNPPRLFYAADEDLGTFLAAQENPCAAGG